MVPFGIVILLDMIRVPSISLIKIVQQLGKATNIGLIIATFFIYLFITLFLYKGGLNHGRKYKGNYHRTEWRYYQAG